MSGSGTGDVLDRLALAIAAEGGEVAAAVVPPRSAAAFGPLAAAGPRARGSEDEYSLLIEAMFEGYLQHYGEPRVVEPADPDLRLLAGDHLYAFGLSRLAGLGDLDAVAELADLISLCAVAHASGRAGGEDPAESLPAALWSLSALAVGFGSWEGRKRVRRGLQLGPWDGGGHHGPGQASEALSVAASRAVSEAASRAAALGVEVELERALIGFRGAASRPLGTT